MGTPCVSSWHRQNIRVMKLAPDIIEEFVILYAGEYGETLDPDEAEQMIRQLFNLYQAFYEWHYHRTQQERRTADADS
jgi:hypothetical protein